MLNVFFMFKEKVWPMNIEKDQIGLIKTKTFKNEKYST